MSAAISHPLRMLLAQSHPGEGWIGNWSPGIGDPNFFGWLTVVAYLVAAYLCSRVVRRLRSRGRASGAPRGGIRHAVAALFMTGRRIARLPSSTRVSALWKGFAAVMLFLGINKQLDLQTIITEIGRMTARSEGWYEVRRRVQLAFILLVLLAGLWIFRTVLALAAGKIHEMALVLTGSVFLICFIAVRASSFHHVDRLLGLDFGGLRVNSVLELGGIGLVIANAWQTLKRNQVIIARPIPPRPEGQPGHLLRKDSGVSRQGKVDRGPPRR